MWLEHYALSESGYNSLFTPQQRQRYLRAISDKRRIHKVNKTTLLETWSFYTDRRPLLDHLKEVLEKEGFILKPRNMEEVYKKIVETGKDKYMLCPFTGGAPTLFGAFAPFCPTGSRLRGGLRGERGESSGATAWTDRFLSGIICRRKRK